MEDGQVVTDEMHVEEQGLQTQGHLDYRQAGDELVLGQSGLVSHQIAGRLFVGARVDAL